MIVHDCPDCEGLTAGCPRHCAVESTYYAPEDHVQIGWCSLCGGSVVTYERWAGSPESCPRWCESCRAVPVVREGSVLPVIPMVRPTAKE